MRYNEMKAFNKLLKTLDLEPYLNEKFTYGQNWEDVPFHNLKSLKVDSWGESYRDFGTPPNWFEILKTIDELLVKDNDYHHKWISGFNHQGCGSYYVSMDS